ncbi:MAG TPA: class I SAM-dependent methyltransferase [Candidatus Eisenbacteria bacterium]
MSGDLGPRYDARLAASYWGGPRLSAGPELSAVLSLGEAPAVNEAYDAWESGLVLASVEGLSLRKVLDLGAGVGRLTVRLAGRASRVAAGDLAPGMLRRLRRNAAAHGAGNVDPVRLRSDQLPFRSGALDLVLCLGLLEHLPEPLRRATLEEAARVLRPGGVLLVVLNNRRSEFLQDRCDNPLRVGRQQESGYYCEVLDDEAILGAVAASFAPRPLGSNLLYSLQRHAARLLPESLRGDPRIGPFFARASELDRALRPLGGLARRAADHHLYACERR